MAGKAGVKAGLIGSVVLLIVTTLNNLLPISGVLVHVLCGISIMIYAGIGALAGLFSIPPRTPGKGASAGAIAGLIGSGINGAVGVVITSIRLSRGLGMAGADPQQMQQLLDAGYNPKMFLPISIACGLIISAGVAAVGGAALAVVKPD